MPEFSDKNAKQRAVLVSLRLPGVSDAENSASLDELARLVQTLGFEVVGRLSQNRPKPSIATVIGEGKLRELAAFTGGTGVVESYSKSTGKRDDNEDEEESEGPEIATDDEEDDSSDSATVPSVRAGIVVFDLEISPTQLRNLEQATGAEVLDRTGVILEIFSRHARSREARLQVEIAKLGYLAPRLRASNVGEDRQGGGIGAKGSGETSHELDRRRIRDRIAELQADLKSIHGEQQVRRAKRQEALSVALVGYTNAGKSSLMRALTGSEVLVADKLFATLDTTVRALQPETIPRLLVSDTVGFIKKLPHDLVASFRSTLDEALSASLLLFVVDSADPSFRSQLEVTRTVISEIGAGDYPFKLILNKRDQLSELQYKGLTREFPDAVFISTRDAADVTKMRQIIVEFFERDMIDVEIFLPYKDRNLIGAIHENVKIVSEHHDDTGTKMTIRGYREATDRVTKLLLRR